MVATNSLHLVRKMPRACPVESHVRGCREISNQRELPRGKPVASSTICKLIGSCEREYHGASPWHLQRTCSSLVVANVNYHGASPWHLDSVSSKGLIRISLTKHLVTRSPEVGCDSVFLLAATKH